MTPRAKSTLIITAILLALLPTLYFLAASILNKGFGELETRDARQHLQRAVDGLNSDLTELARTTQDWAARDASYNFVAGQNMGYLEATLFPEKVLNLRLNLVVFMDSDRRIVAAKSYDLINGLPGPAPQNLDKIIAGNNTLVAAARDREPAQGIIFVDGRPMLAAAAAVTPDNPRALFNGSVVFGRYLDPDEIQRLADLTDLILEIRPLEPGSLPPDYQAAASDLERNPVSLRPLDSQTFAAYQLLPDIAGVPRQIMRVQVLRSVYQQGQQTLRFFLFSLLVIGLLFGVAGQATLEKMMVSQRSSLENLGRYAAVVKQISEGMAQVDAGSKVILEANPSFAAMLGYETAGMVGLSLYKIAQQEPLEVDNDFEQVLSNGQFLIGERSYRRKNGGSLDVEVNASRIYYGGRDVLVMVLRDITARKEAEKALIASQERYQLATQGANDGLWDWDLKTNEIYFSARWKAMLGYEDGEIKNSPDEWFNLVHPDDLKDLTANLDAHLGGRGGHFQSEHRVRHRDGSYRWMLSRGQAIWSADGSPYRMAGSQTDITDRKSSEEQFRYDAFHDALTGLPNRALFMDRLGQAIERSRRRPHYLFALLFLDFDRFKVINDSLGHTIGDQLLVSGARRLETCLRAMDTIARLGGDEFVILLEYIDSPRDAIRVAERISEALQPPFNLNGHEIFISASTGIVLSSIGYEKAEDALRDADIAMYRSKALGRARYELFNPDLRSMAMARLELETDMRRALERGEFSVNYQPILNLSTSSITGFEALIRWRHPALGMIPPADFIPVAEETGLILPIGQWVLREACRQMKEWQQQFPRLPDLTISVNMSGKQFAQPDLPQEIDRILHETGLNIDCLRLEITESVIMEAIESTTNLLKQLKAMGVQLEIDDFGTGYSSLSYLQQLPIDAIKIDRSFIRQMECGANDHGIVQAIVALAHNLGMHVIAEGVEASDQLDRLKAMDCELGQGFLFHRPLESRAVCDLLTEVQVASR